MRQGSEALPPPTFFALTAALRPSFELAALMASFGHGRPASIVWLENGNRADRLAEHLVRTLTLSLLSFPDQDRAEGSEALNIIVSGPVASSSYRRLLSLDKMIWSNLRSSPKVSQIHALAETSFVSIIRKR